MSNTVIVIRLPEEVCDDCAKEIVEEVLKEKHNLTLDEVDLSIVQVKAVSVPPAIKELIEAMPPEVRNALSALLAKKDTNNEG